MSRDTYHTIDTALRRVNAEIEALLSLPHAARGDYWWEEEFARLQKSRDALRKAIALEKHPVLKLMLTNPRLWNRKFTDQVDVRIGGMSFAKRIGY